MKAVGFDLGDTLIYYENVPLSWKNLYRSALIEIMQAMQIRFTETHIRQAEQVLSLYNTRIYPRDFEVTDLEVFDKVLAAWGISGRKADEAASIFFSFFQQRSKAYPDAAPVLKELKQRGLPVGILTDVPYGMSMKYVEQDIEPVREYIDVILSSAEIGFRKPRTEGFIRLAKELGMDKPQILYVGNEEKDIIGANQSGMVSVLMNRDQQLKNWGQQITIRSLTEILNYF